MTDLGYSVSSTSTTPETRLIQQGPSRVWGLRVRIFRGLSSYLPGSGQEPFLPLEGAGFGQLKSTELTLTCTIGGGVLGLVMVGNVH